MMQNKGPFRFLKHRLFKLFVSVIILIIILVNINLGEVVEQLTRFSLPFLVFYLTSLFLVLFITAFRWLILTQENLTLNNFLSFFLATLRGVYYNLIMPSTIGGDLLKGLSLLDLKISKKKLAFSILLDRFVGLFGLILLGNLFLFYGFLHQNIILPREILFLVVLLLIMSLTSIIAFFLKLDDVMIAIIRSLLSIDDHKIQTKKKIETSQIRQKMVKIFKKSQINYSKIQKYLRQNTKVVVIAIGLSLISQFANNALIFLAAETLNFDLSLVVFISIIPIIMLLINLPISFAGFGTTEVIFIYFFSQLGIGNDKILALTSFIALSRILLALFSWLVVNSVDQIAPPTKKTS